MKVELELLGVFEDKGKSKTTGRDFLSRGFRCLDPSGGIKDKIIEVRLDEDDWQAYAVNEHGPWQDSELRGRRFTFQVMRDLSGYGRIAFGGKVVELDLPHLNGE